MAAPRTLAAAIAAPTAADLSALRAAEWSATTDRDEGGTEPVCPHCRGERRNGHVLRCFLASAIAIAEGRS